MSQQQVKEIDTAAAANVETLSQNSAEGSVASTSNSEIPNPKFKTALCRNYISKLFILTDTIILSLPH